MANHFVPSIHALQQKSKTKRSAQIGESVCSVRLLVEFCRKIFLHVFHAFPCIFFLFVLEWFYRNSYYLEWIHSPQHL